MTTRHWCSVFILSILLSGLQVTSAPNPVGPTAIPTTVATFVQGDAAGDEATMLPVASPIFWIELSRRGVTTTAQRAEVRPRGLTFTPRGGTRDAHGFGHWFYTTRSARSAGKAPLTIWRIDSDLNGLVIWIEPVYFFSGCDDAMIGANPPPSHGQSDEILTVSPMTQFALHCTATAEGYYVIQSRDGHQISYSAVNAYGDVLPGAWSFGQIEERGEGSIASILSRNALFKGPGGQEYTTYYQSVRR
jgi:hypothetical protein